MDNHFDPKKYGMLLCIDCEGNGKLSKDSEDIEVCLKCGGFGFIKKEEGPNRRREREGEGERESESLIEK